MFRYVWPTWSLPLSGNISAGFFKFTKFLKLYYLATWEATHALGF